MVPWWEGGEKGETCASYQRFDHLRTFCTYLQVGYCVEESILKLHTIVHVKSVGTWGHQAECVETIVPQDLNVRSIY